MFALTGALRPVQDSPTGDQPSLRMDDVQTVRHHLGGTVNDVAIAAVQERVRALRSTSRRRCPGQLISSPRAVTASAEEVPRGELTSAIFTT